MTLRKQILILVGLSIVLSLGSQAVQKKAVPLWGFPKPIALVQPKAAMAGADAVSPDSAFAPSDSVYAADLSAAMGLYMKRKKANVHFIDARDPKVFADGHIPGATNIPFEQVVQYADSLKKFPKMDLCLLYCDGGDCHLSHDLAEHMLAHGWKRLVVYADEVMSRPRTGPDLFHAL